MHNTLIGITYDGTAYCGFQIQAGDPTIQQEIESALAVIYKQPVRIHGAGRTDSGVHARGQAATFLAPYRIDAKKLPHALNTLLPGDIVINAVSEVPDNFHARFNARGKGYSYTIDRAEFPQVMASRYSWHLPEELDIAAMQEAARLFEGAHDFCNFRAAGSSVQETVRIIHRCEIVYNPAEELLRMHFEGSGFLYRMVRLISGSLVRIGKGLLTPPEIKAALGGEINRAPGPTAPAHGLCLEKVIYEPEN